MTVRLAQKKPLKLRVLRYEGDLMELHHFTSGKTTVLSNGLQKGDWLIEGQHGEFYSMGDDEFRLHFDLLGANVNDA